MKTYFWSEDELNKKKYSLEDGLIKFKKIKRWKLIALVGKCFDVFALNKNVYLIVILRSGNESKSEGAAIGFTIVFFSLRGQF